MAAAAALMQLSPTPAVRRRAALGSIPVNAVSRAPSATKAAVCRSAPRETVSWLREGWRAANARAARAEQRAAKLEADLKLAHAVLAKVDAERCLFKQTLNATDQAIHLLIGSSAVNGDAAPAQSRPPLSGRQRGRSPLVPAASAAALDFEARRADFALPPTHATDAIGRSVEIRMSCGEWKRGVVQAWDAAKGVHRVQLAQPRPRALGASVSKGSASPPRRAIVVDIAGMLGDCSSGVRWLPQPPSSGRKRQRV